MSASWSGSDAWSSAFVRSMATRRIVPSSGGSIWGGPAAVRLIVCHTPWTCSTPAELSLATGAAGALDGRQFRAGGRGLGEGDAGTSGTALGVGVAFGDGLGLGFGLGSGLGSGLGIGLGLGLGLANGDKLARTGGAAAAATGVSAISVASRNAINLVAGSVGAG